MQILHQWFYFLHKLSISISLCLIVLTGFTPMTPNRVLAPNIRNIACNRPSMVPKMSAVDAEAMCRRFPLLILAAALFILLLFTIGSFCSISAVLGSVEEIYSINFHENNYNEIKPLCLVPQGTYMT